MSVYSAFRYWSPVLGSEAVRVWMDDEKRSGVWWTERAIDGSAKGYRVERDRALDALEAAIVRGDPPGEVA